MASSIRLVSTVLVAVAFLALCGCERKEKIIEIDTPGGRVEVERSLDTGKVDIEVTDKK